MAYKIFVINPGSTTTKVAYYEDETQVYNKSIEHTDEELDRYDSILAQEDFRTAVVRKAIEDWDIDIDSLSVIMARGNLLPGMSSGGYKVDANMVDALRSGIASPHASNLAALIAYSIAEPHGIPAFIYDSVTSDEFAPIAKITGLPGVKRQNMCHVLNMKAVSRKVAEEDGKRYEDIKVIVAHLGGGITISVHENGRIVDALRDDDGPFSPERTGSISVLYVLDMAYSGDFTKKEMISFIRGKGGIKAYLGTSDMRKVEQMIADGNQEAKLLYEAMAYQIAKGIGLLAPVVSGKLDHIILTGGMVAMENLVNLIRERVEFIAPVVLVPGEFEMDALAQGATRILDGESYRLFKLEKNEK